MHTHTLNTNNTACMHIYTQACYTENHAWACNTKHSNPCTFVHVHKHTNTMHKHISMHACMHTDRQTDKHLNTHMHIRTHTQKHTYVQASARAHFSNDSRAQLPCQLLKTARAESVLHQPFSSNMSTSVLSHIKFAKTHMNEFNNQRCFISSVCLVTWDEPPRHRRMYTKLMYVRARIKYVFLNIYSLIMLYARLIPRWSRLVH